MLLESGSRSDVTTSAPGSQFTLEAAVKHLAGKYKFTRYLLANPTDGNALKDE